MTLLGQLVKFKYGLYVDNRIVISVCFLNLFIVLWLCRKISLFLKGGGGDEESPEGDSCLRATINQIPLSLQHSCLQSQEVPRGDNRKW